MAAATENAVSHGPASGICANADASAAMPHPARSVTSFKTSLFCSRLQECAANGDTTLKNLATATERLLDHAEAISDQVVRFLPQFTLHNGTHLWNVLSFMEELAGGKDGIDKLEAGDCAMAVWACFLHDLGMVLEAGEVAAIEAADRHDLFPLSGDASSPDATVSGSHATQVQAWRAYRDGQSLWESIRRDPNPDCEASRIKLGIIRAAFVRDTHALLDPYTGHCRIADWLEILIRNDNLVAEAVNNYGFSSRLILVAISHNQDIRWLPNHLRPIVGGQEYERCHAEPNGSLGTIHWTWIGWLLRLADIFDCDASRTPAVLFHHGGITDHRSKSEWRKHLAIHDAPEWGAGDDARTLLYTCQKSPSPAVEKSLNEIRGWMQDEISKCLMAWDAMPERSRQNLQLALPSRAAVQILNRQDGYIFYDIEFRLERDSVVDLLMGENLYGGPKIALRELVQNALDAVQLRDQRMKLAIKLENDETGEKPLQPYENWGAKKGEVQVEWGTEQDGRSWIRVKDNGVGMTLGTMKRFLTQVGHSYYKSSDFLSEQAQMRRHGIICSAISQFGIGFLSVFMLADHVEIRTRPVKASDRPNQHGESIESERFPFRAEIHGPHGLLAFYPDMSIRTPGTEVTLWLKRGDHGERPFALQEWDRQSVIDRLRNEFYGPEVSDQELADLFKFSPPADNRRFIDPAYEIGRLIVWPLYPVKLVPPQAAEGITLDDRFHFAVLAPLDRHRLAEEADQWDQTFPEIASVAWKACDWTDPETGSRLRLVAAHPEEGLPWSVEPKTWSELPDSMPKRNSRLALHTLSEPGLPSHERRYQCLVNGIRVVPGLVTSGTIAMKKLPRILEDFPVWPGTGGWLWLDLRGAAMPRLRADRSDMTHSQPADWNLNALCTRWLKTWPESLPAWLRSVAHSRDLRRKTTPPKTGPIRLGLPSLSPGLLRQNLLAEFQSSGGYHFPGKYGHLIARDTALSKRTGHIPRLFRERALLPPAIFDQELIGALVAQLGFDFDFSKSQSFNIGHYFHSDFSRELDSIVTSNFLRSFLLFRRLHLVSESFHPSLEGALPALGWDSLTGVLLDYFLVGPLHMSAEGATSMPQWLSPYDLASPATGIALRHLREVRASWMTQRGERALFLLPLLLGKEPNGWRERLTRNKPFPRLMIFLPNPDHYEWLFADSAHPQEEWAQGSASALWDLETGKVLYADGIHTEESLRAKGRSLREWAGWKD